MQHRPVSAERRPGFFWQGALILLPALALAAAGLYSLRREDVLARHEAETQAKQIASELADRLIPGALRFELPDAESVRRAPGVPEEEALLRITRPPLAGSAFLTGADGALLYPPKPSEMPRPEPLDEAELSHAQQDGWLSLEDAWGRDLPESGRLLEDFLARNPPERFAAIGRFRTAMTLARAQQSPAAAALLRTIQNLPDDVTGETGMPLRWLAEWKLATLPSEPRSPGSSLNALAAQLLLHPSTAADALLARIAADDPAMSGWETARGAHEKARRFATSFPDHTPETLITLDGHPHWPMAQEVNGGRWRVAVPLEALAAETARLDRSIIRSEHFGLAASLGPETLLPRPGDSEVLARATAASPPVAVEVFLKDPAAYAAERHARTLRFAALIALSAGTVVIGFVSARRSFHRQRRLSEMKSNFVSSVSHELRAPIASVRLMAEELEHGEAPGPEKLRDYTRFIGQECRRLSTVIENVLDFSRREQGREQFDFDDTDLVALAETTVALMRTHGGERGVTIDLRITGQPQPITADGSALQRLLVNLVDNALKHAPPESVVTVGLEFAPDRVALWVEDSGPGIPAGEHGRIFERFYRVGSELRRQTPGVGLGLSIVKHLAEVHGGTVRVRSAPGEGARFTVELPLIPSAEVTPSPLIP